MSQILSENSIHVQLNKVDSNKKETMIFPVNTVDDVIINDEGDVLTDYLPTVDNDVSNPTEKSGFLAVETGEETVSDTVLDKLNTI